MLIRGLSAGSDLALFSLNMRLHTSLAGSNKAQRKIPLARADLTWPGLSPSPSVKI
jgi:hypothetical protein